MPSIYNTPGFYGTGLTARGRAACERIPDVLREIEKEWSLELVARDFARLKKLLLRAWKSVSIG